MTPTGPGPETVLRVENLSFMYDEGSWALRNISFCIQRGEFVALLASNGGGKTTLLKCLAGLLRCQRGTVELLGRELKDWPTRELIGKLGLCFQNPSDQLFGATVFEDAAYGPRNLGLGEAEVRATVTEVLGWVGLPGMESVPVHHLSFGQQKRLGIAGVLAMGPELLVLDEPTAGLDPAGESEIMRLLSRLNREKRITIIMATHLIDLLPLFLDRIGVIRDGALADFGRPEKIFADREMMRSVGLRVPYITTLIDELRSHDRVPVNGHPLTIGEARRRLVEMINELPGCRPESGPG